MLRNPLFFIFHGGRGWGGPDPLSPLWIRTCKSVPILTLNIQEDVLPVSGCITASCGLAGDGAVTQIEISRVCKYSMCGSRGGGQGVRTPLKNHKNIGFSSNTGPDSLKNRSYQASIQCWANIGTPVKRHLMAFRWRADDGPLKGVLGSPTLINLKKNVVKVGPPLTNLSGSAQVMFIYNYLIRASLRRVRNRKIIFLFLNQHICCGYSKEPSL